MKCLSLGLVSCLAWQAAAWNYVSETKLQDALDVGGYTLVAFVLPSQTESKALEQVWVSMQEREKDDNIISFDCETNLKKCRELDVVSFPTIRVYHRDGRMDRYRGRRKGREIALFLGRTLRPPVLEIDAHADTSLPRLDDVVIIAFIHPSDWTLYERFYDVGREYRDRFSFVISSPAEGATRSLLTCYNNLDGERYETYETSEVAQLENFVKFCGERVIPDLTRQVWERYSETGNLILHYFSTQEDEKERYRKEVGSLATKHRKAVRFVVTDPIESSEIIPAFQSLEESVPDLLLEDTKTGEVYAHRLKEGEKLTKDNVKRFVESVKEGMAKAWDTSEPKRGSQQGGRSHEEL